MDDVRVELTVTEFGILRTLLEARGRVLTRGQLIDRVREADTHITERTVDTHVRRIRAKLRPHGFDPIETVHGLGYKAALRRRHEPPRVALLAPAALAACASATACCWSTWSSCRCPCSGSASRASTSARCWPRVETDMIHQAEVLRAMLRDDIAAGGRRRWRSAGRC